MTRAGIFLFVLLGGCTMSRPPEMLSIDSGSADLVARFENRLAETLFDELEEDLESGEPDELPAILSRHRQILARSLDRSRLTDRNRNRLDLIDYLYENHMTVSDGAEPFSVRLRHLASFEPDLPGLTRQIDDGLSRMQDAIRKQAGITAQDALRDYFDTIRIDPARYPADSDSGRQAYLTRIVDSLMTVQPLLTSLTRLAPDRALRLEGTENLPALFSYEPESATLKVEISNPRLLPLFEIESMALFFGVPGLHLMHTASHRSPVQNMLDLSGVTRGWALYALRALGHIPYYQHPAQTLDRLWFESMLYALARADIGLNSGQWTEQEAMDYLLDHTPYSTQRIERSLSLVQERPALHASTLAAYFELARIRQETEKSQGLSFHRTAFHDRILGAGPLPLHLLEKIVSAPQSGPEPW